MARPTKIGLDYFPMDVDFFSDEKIFAINAEFGIKGEAVVLRLLCAIYRNGYFIEWTEVLQIKLLRTMTGVSASLLKEIVERLVKWGFFDEGLFRSSHILTSRGIQKRFFAATRGRKKTAEMPYLLLSEEAEGVSDAETPQSKGKKSKVNENKTSSDDDAAVLTPTTATPPITNKIDNEIEVLKTEECWLNQLQVLHKLETSTIRAKLDDFRAQCLADGKAGHASMQDAKAHFNSWLRINLKEETKQTKYYDSKNKRDSYEIPKGSRKTYGRAF